MHEKNRTKSRNALYSSCLKGSDQLVNEMEKHYLGFMYEENLNEN